MGLNFFSTSKLGRKVSSSIMGISKSQLGDQQRVPPPPNPNPFRFDVVEAEHINGFLLLVIKYPDATNFEGLKILLFDRGVTLDALLQQRAIDPHFSDSQEYIHPIARFEPTGRGWNLARKACA
jgi:hypothetical protein